MDSNNTLSSETFSDLSHDVQCPHKICSGSGIESKLPPVFVKRMRSDFETTAEFEHFIACYSDAPVRAMRINTLKISKERFIDLCPWRTKQSELLNEGLILTENPEHIGTHPYHIAGLFYMQEPSAMSVVEAAEIAPGMRVLDLCAAPGGKSGGIAARLCGRGILVSNEIIPNRAKLLARNLERLGIVNAVVTSAHPDAVAEALPQYFDRVVVDAPCSGEGMFRKEEAAVTDWTEDTNAICANRQSEILTSAAKMLRPGGRLVYSTCTFSPVENEGVISDFLWRNPDFSVENRPAPDFSPGRPDWVEHPAPGLEHTFRLWPHKLRGEGHYAAVLKKAGDAPAAELPLEPAAKTPAELTQFCRQTGAALPEGKLLLFGQVAYLVPQELPEIKGLRVLRAGLELGQTMKNRFEPAHAWALWLKGLENSVSLAADAPELGQYLSGNVLPSGLRGWTLMRVDGLSLGWAKGDGTQLKNHYPKALRRPV